MLLGHTATPPGPARGSRGHGAQPGTRASAVGTTWNLAGSRDRWNRRTLGLSALPKPHLAQKCHPNTPHCYTSPGEHSAAWESGRDCGGHQVARCLPAVLLQLSCGLGQATPQQGPTGSGQAPARAGGRVRTVRTPLPWFCCPAPPISHQPGLCPWLTACEPLPGLHDPPRAAGLPRWLGPPHACR